MSLIQCIQQNWNIELGTKLTVVAEVGLKRLSMEQKETLQKYLEQNQGLSLLEISDALNKAAFGNGGAPILPPFVAVSLRSISEVQSKIERREKVKVGVTPVHGPFEPSVYEDPVFVANYTRARYWSRVAEVKSILASLGDIHIIAPGDGAGVAYQAAQQLQAQGHKISVASFDSSVEMCKVASKLGNIVEVKTLQECLHNFKGHYFFLSHVTDYMTEDLITDYSREKVIVYGRAVKFPRCVWYKPYDKDWGYQLCSSNWELPGISLCMSPKVVPSIDYTVFSALDTIATQMIDVDIEDPLYVQEAREMGLVVSTAANVVITSDIRDKRKIVAMPHVGIIGEAWGSSLFLVSPLELVPFASFHAFPYFFSPVYIGYKFFFQGESVRVNDGSRSIMLSTKKIGSHQFVNIPIKFRKGCVELDGCLCFGNAKHFHVLKIVAPSRVVWRNLVAAVRRDNAGMCTQKQLMELFFSVCGRRDGMLTAIYESMERVNEVEYGQKDGYYVSSDD